MPMLTNGAQYARYFQVTQGLFAARCHVLIQQPAHPLRPTQLQPGVTLGLGVGTPRYRSRTGWRRVAPCARAGAAAIFRAANQCHAASVVFR